MRNNSFIHTALMSCLLLLCGCSEELVPGTPPPTEGLTLRYTIDNLTDGQVTDASTYAGTILAPTQGEAVVDDMTLLFFNAGDTGNGAYVGYAQPDANAIKNPTVDAWEMHTTSITPPSGTKLTLDGTKDYSVLAIANHEVNGWPLAKIKQVVETANATERSVKYALTTDTAAVHRTDTLLMSGSGKYSGKEKSVTIALRRNVAKVMVVNGMSLGNFKLEKAWIANLRAQSYVMDMQGEMPVEMLQGVDLIREKTLTDAVQYASFYCFEHYTEEVAEKTGLCVILLGSYRKGKSQYYRLDVNTHEIDPVNKRFVQRISRNALYKMTITAVLGSGMNTLDEALVGVADQLVVHQGFSWEENFDGIYNYASNGIGFAPGYSSIDERTMNFEQLKVPLYWNSYYTIMATPPASGVTVKSSDPNVIEVTLSSKNDTITCTPKKWGEAVVTIQYADAIVRSIPVRYRSYIQSALFIKNLIVDKYNLGGSESNIYGNYYNPKEAKPATKAASTRSVCPSGWRLPTRSEIDHMYDQKALRVTASGFILGVEEGIISLFPNAGYTLSGSSVEKGDKAYYLTASVTGDYATPNAIVYQTVTTSEGKVELGIKEVSNTISTERFSVRCIGTQNTSKPYEFVDPATGTWEVKVSGGVPYDQYVAGKPGDGYELADTEMLDKILRNGGYPGGGPIPFASWYWGSSISDTHADGRLYGDGSDDVPGKIITGTYAKTESHQGFYVKKIAEPSPKP